MSLGGTARSGDSPADVAAEGDCGDEAGQPTGGSWLRSSGHDRNRADRESAERGGFAGTYTPLQEVRGIKYRDQMSRGKLRYGMEGSHNYVIFDEADVSIEEVQASMGGPPVNH